MAKKRGAARQPQALQMLKAVVWARPDQRAPMRKLWEKKKAGGVLDDDEVSAVWRILEKGHFVFDLAGKEGNEEDDA